MTGTDMPRRKWGVIGVLASIAQARRTTLPPPGWGYRAVYSGQPRPGEPGYPPPPPRQRPTIASVINLPEMVEADAQMRDRISRLTRTLLSDEGDAIVALHERADELGIRAGVRVTYRTEDDGDHIQVRMTAKLSRDVPPRVVDRRWEFGDQTTTGDS